MIEKIRAFVEKLSFIVCYNEGSVTVAIDAFDQPANFRLQVFQLRADLLLHSRLSRLHIHDPVLVHSSSPLLGLSWLCAQRTERCTSAL